VANGHLNVANGFISKHLKKGYFGRNNTNITAFPFNLHFEHENNVKRDGPGYKICQKSLGILECRDALLLHHRNVANDLIYSPQLWRT